MVHRVVVVLTDGNPTAGHAGGTAAALLRENHHATIIAVGVGANANRSELVTIAGQTGGHRRASMRPHEVYSGVDVAAAGPSCDDDQPYLCPALTLALADHLPDLQRGHAGRLRPRCILCAPGVTRCVSGHLLRPQRP